ncbi:MAG: LacI family DNA-binding transcriptional regulator [Oscillospiraceae bacterium]|nr:LacI family DNA-binding transcriptional regulator [Oscillospiraceae bacterium]
MATIKDVARMAGVAPSTISKYINGGSVRKENAEAIRAAIEKLEYRVDPFARGLKAHRNRSVGVLLPDMTAPFYGNVVMAISRVMRERDYHCLISSYGANHGLERDNLAFMLTCGIDGLFYSPEDLSAEEFKELTAHCGIPIVQFDRMIQGVDVDTVLVDNTDVVYRAVSKLIANGHTKIAIITGPKSVFTAKERMVGYLRALADGGILYNDNWVISGQNDFATGYRSYETLMEREDRPTAVFTTNYDITTGFITAARERGLRVPGDVDVFGFDSVEICSMMTPPLSVVHQPDQLIGQTAAKFLLDRLDGYNGDARIARLKCRITPE